MDNILALHGLMAGLKSTDKQALIDIANQADSANTIVKQNIVTALATKGVTANPTDSWNSLITKMNMDDANALASDIAIGKTVYVNGTKLTGTSLNYDRGDILWSNDLLDLSGNIMTTSAIQSISCHDNDNVLNIFDGYIFTAVTNQYVYKKNLSTGVSTTFTLSTSTDRAVKCVSDGTYLYVYTYYSSSAKIMKFNLDGTYITNIISLNVNTNGRLNNELFIKNGFLYLCANNSSTVTNLIKIDLSTFTLVSTTTLTGANFLGGATYVTCIKYDANNGYLYIRSSTKGIAKFSPETATYITTYADLDCTHIDGVNGIACAVLNGVFTKFDFINNVTIGTLTLPTTVTGNVHSIGSDGDYVFGGGANGLVAYRVRNDLVKYLQITNVDITYLDDDIVVEPNTETCYFVYEGGGVEAYFYKFSTRFMLN